MGSTESPVVMNNDVSQSEETIASAMESNQSLAQDVHPLHRQWSLWFDKREKTSTANYEDLLQHVYTFGTIEEFWKIYSHLVRPSELPRDCSYHIFEGTVKPTWENYTNGGSFVFRIRNRNSTAEDVNRVWERLAMSILGEVFEDINIIGIGIGMKHKDESIHVWTRSPISVAHKQHTMERIREVCGLHEHTAIDYRVFRSYLQM